MMGDTGSCGPCSELHVDLTPEGTEGKLLMLMMLYRVMEFRFHSIYFESDGSFRPCQNVKLNKVLKDLVQ